MPVAAAIGSTDNARRFHITARHVDRELEDLISSGYTCFMWVFMRYGARSAMYSLKGTWLGVESGCRRQTCAIPDPGIALVNLRQCQRTARQRSLAYSVSYRPPVPHSPKLMLPVKGHDSRAGSLMRRFSVGRTGLRYSVAVAGSHSPSVLMKVSLFGVGWG